MMRVETVPIFTFGELSDDAKARAIESARAAGWGEDGWGEEWRESLDKAAEALGFTVKDWSVGGRGTFCSIDAGPHSDAMTGVRAWKWLHNNGVADAIAEPCPFTGYCGDEALLDPLRAFLLAPDGRSVEEVFEDCATSWARAWEEDMEYQSSDEAIAESLEVNEVEFTGSGDLWS